MATTAILSQARTNVLTGCFFIRVFLLNYGKILKFSIVELEKCISTQNDCVKIPLGSVIISGTYLVKNESSFFLELLNFEFVMQDHRNN